MVSRIDRVRDGEEALDYLFGADFSLDGQARPALVLIDLNLPGFDGLEVVRQIKASPRLKDIPVVVLTSSEAKEDLARAYALHANSYLVKPMELEEWSALLDELAKYWLDWNHGA